MELKLLENRRTGLRNLHITKTRKTNIRKSGSIPTDYLEVIESDTQGPFPIMEVMELETISNLWIKRVDMLKWKQLQIEKLPYNYLVCM
jgi:hypothetical protein